MIVFLWTLNGRPLEAQDLADPDLAERVMDVTLQFQHKVGEVSCAAHGRGPILEVDADGPDRYDLQVRGCCETMVDEVLARLA